MKRFTIAAVVLGASILVVWTIFQWFTPSQHPPENRIAPVALQTVQAEYINTPDSSRVLVPTSDVESRSVAPVFDSNGRVVSDPSGVLSNSTRNFIIPMTGKGMSVAPVIDSTGRVVSNPSGLHLDMPYLDGLRYIAPVFDSNGRVVSDPSGAMINSSHP